MSWRVKFTVVFVLVVCWMAPVVVREVTSPAAVLFTGGCVLALGAAALAAWHHRKTLEYRDRLAPLDGWEKVGPDRWRCPYCANDVTGWRARKHHATAVTSSCAALQLHLGSVTDAVKEALPGTGWPATLEPAEDAEREAVDT